MGVALPPPTLELVMGSSIEVVPGATGHVDAWIARGGAFSGAVNLSASDAPSGMQVTFQPGATIFAGSTWVSVDVAVDAGVALGTRTIEITAVGEGPEVPSASKTLTVVVVAPAGSVSLTAAPTLLAVAVGASAVTSTITIERTAPFSGPVDLMLAGTPNGVIATLSPGTTEATFTLSVSAPNVGWTWSGDYVISVRASGGGIADAVRVRSHHSNGRPGTRLTHLQPDHHSGDRGRLECIVCHDSNWLFVRSAHAPRERATGWAHGQLPTSHVLWNHRNADRTGGRRCHARHLQSHGPSKGVA